MIGLLFIFGGISILFLALSPIMIGFTSIGVAAGSFAAAWQSSIGIVSAGSIFSKITAFVMGGTALKTAVGGIVSTILGFVVGY